jgi:DNA-binding IclR family transcriptional regulator
MQHKPRARKSDGPGVRPLSSVLKALAVLDALGKSERAMRLVEVAGAVGGSRATTYQKLVTLIAAGWAEQTDVGSYRLSLHAANTGAAALEQASLGERATVIMQELVHDVRETASLAVLSGIQAQLVKRVEAEVVVRAQVRVGTLLSLDHSSSGRVLTAFAADDVLDMLRRRGAVLASAAVLSGVRRQGYAVSTGRDTPGVQSIAAPVFDAGLRCISALSVVAPVSRFEAARYVRPLLRATGSLHALMSGAPSRPLVDGGGR